MKSSETPTDKIFARAQFAVHYRCARRIRWSSEARPVYSVLFLLRGEWRWNCSYASQRTQQHAGALLVGPGEVVHAGTSTQASYIVLTLSPVYVLDCAVRARLTRSDALVTFRVCEVTDDQRLERLAGELAQELIEETAGQELVVPAIVEQTIVHLLRRYANIRRSDEVELSRAGFVDRRIRRAVELMYANLDRELPLEEIAAAAYLSPFHFARLFKKLTGTSPHAYLAALRTARAQTLLAETDLSVTEIGARVGHASSSHFAKAFRQATGLSPRAFRAALPSR